MRRGLVIARGFTFWGSSRNTRDTAASWKTFARGQSRRKSGKKLAPRATASLQSKLSWSVTRTVYELCRPVTDATPAGSAICMSPTMFSASRSWLLEFAIYQVASWKMQIRARSADVRDEDGEGGIERSTARINNAELYSAADYSPNMTWNVESFKTRSL